MKRGDWVVLGRYGRRGTKADEIWWRAAGPIGDAMSLISAYVLTDVAFDDERRGYEHGDNRWSECTVRMALNSEKSFLRAFAPEDLAFLQTVTLKTEVVSSYRNQRQHSVDTTEDRVWLPTWEEYRKLPKELQGNTLTKAFLRDQPDRDGRGHWSRSPLDGFGCAVLDLWFSKKEECNSGASVAWGVRPWIAIDKNASLEGKGTEKKPFRLADFHS